MLAYAASYFARGWLAGHQWFGLYGGLVFLEATSRLLFALAVAVGIAEGQTVVALGMAAAPLVSLVVVPLAFRRRPPAPEGGRRTRGTDLDLARGGRFALAVLAIMVAEQTLINAAVLTTEITATDAAAAGFVFNVLLIARAPLQLFQAIQGSLLPHLAGLEAGEDRAAAARAVRVTLLAITGFAAAVALGLLLVGPWAMDVLFDDGATYGRWGLALVAVGMGLHLTAGHPQPGGPGARPRRPCGRRLADRRRGLRGLARLPGDRRRAAAGGGRVHRLGGPAVRAARGRLLRSPRRVRSGGHGVHP